MESLEKSAQGIKAKAKKGPGAGETKQSAGNV